MVVQAAQKNPEAEQAAQYKFKFDFCSESERCDLGRSNESNRADIMKKYLVYMELPKIKIGDYRKSSCVSGKIIRFHFLLRIAKDEARTVLRLLPIKTYKVPVVNFAVIHRPFLDDDEAKGPIPKSPGVRSPLVRKDRETNKSEIRTEDIAEEFRSDKRQASTSSFQNKPSAVREKSPSGQKVTSILDKQLVGQDESPAEQNKPSTVVNKSPARQDRPTPPPSPRQQGASQKLQDENKEDNQMEVGTRVLEPPEADRSSHGGILSDDMTTGTDATARQSKQRRSKKYFVYCEIPKLLIGDYRNSSVVCSEIIHAHFLIKIAKDEKSGQPVLQPIKRYHRPKVNFAVIHRSLIVDNVAIGPIPRDPNVKSPMIKEDDDSDEEEKPKVPPDNIMHATMGFCYGRLPRSKYEVVSQWSLVPNESGALMPELVLGKAETFW